MKLEFITASLHLLLLINYQLTEIPLRSVRAASCAARGSQARLNEAQTWFPLWTCLSLMKRCQAALKKTQRPDRELKITEFKFKNNKSH